eukprot:364743-Chlamydomonas_euryale.AAC.21
MIGFPCRGCRLLGRGCLALRPCLKDDIPLLSSFLCCRPLSHACLCPTLNPGTIERGAQRARRVPAGAAPAVSRAASHGAPPVCGMPRAHQPGRKGRAWLTGDGRQLASHQRRRACRGRPA